MKQMTRTVVEAVAVPKAESSVEITTDSKGTAKLTIKIYHEDGALALQQALELYAKGVKALSC